MADKQAGGKVPMARTEILDMYFRPGRPRFPNAVYDRQEMEETVEMLDARRARGDKVVFIPHLTQKLATAWFGILEHVGTASPSFDVDWADQKFRTLKVTL